MTRSFVLTFSLVMTACGGAQRSDALPCTDYPASPEGSPEEFTLQGLVGDVRVDTPEFCEGNAFIAMDRAGGRAPLSMGTDSCEAEPAECQRIGAELVLTDAMDRLQAEGIHAHTVGLGACGEIQGDYHAWNYSVSVNRWEDADRAVEIVAELMGEYDVSGHAGVTVRRLACSFIQRAE